MKDAICSNEFIIGVAHRTYWMLHRSHFDTYQQCADPPSKKAVAELLVLQMGLVQVPTEEKKAFVNTAMRI